MTLGGNSMFSIALMRNPLSSSSSAGLPTGKGTCQPWLLHILPDKTRGLALKDLENWIFIHTWLGRRKKALPAVSVTQTKALGSNRPQLLDLDLCFLSLVKAQAIALCSRMKGWRPWCVCVCVGGTYILVSWKLYMRSSRILHIYWAHLPCLLLYLGTKESTYHLANFSLLSVLQGPLFSIHTA